MAELIGLLDVMLFWEPADLTFPILLRQCSARIESFCGRVLAARSLTEYYQGTGERLLVLKNRPVNSITSVHEDMSGASGQAENAFGGETLLVQGADYELLKTGLNGAAGSGMLRRINGVWRKPDGFEPGLISPRPMEAGGTIKVAYNAGYTCVPEDLQQACLFLMASVKRMVKIGDNLSSESWENYSYQVGQAAGEAIGGLPTTTLAILSRYRNIALG